MSDIQEHHDEVIRQVVREAVRETLICVGLDMQQPHQLQADMHYLRKLRQGSEDIAHIIRRSLLTAMVSTVLFLLWEAVKMIVQK